MVRLLDFLFPPRSDELLVRSVGAAAFRAFMQPRAVQVTNPPTTALLPFHEPVVRAAVHEAKYHGSPAAFELLADVLAVHVESLQLNHMTALLIPIPLGSARLRERGFNQAEEVARRAAQKTGVPVDTALLVRVRETASQVSLPRREREENMRGAFGAAHPLSPHEQQTIQYMVLDDVLTTGATLQAALDALTEAGAQHISALALAH